MAHFHQFQSTKIFKNKNYIRINREHSYILVPTSIEVWVHYDTTLRVVPLVYCTCKFLQRSKLTQYSSKHSNFFLENPISQSSTVKSVRIGYFFLAHPYLINKESQPICDTYFKALSINHYIYNEGEWHNYIGTSQGLE